MDGGTLGWRNFQILEDLVLNGQKLNQADEVRILPVFGRLSDMTQVLGLENKTLVPTQVTT